MAPARRSETHSLLWLLLLAGVFVHAAEDDDKQTLANGNFRPFEPAPREEQWMELHNKYVQEIQGLAATPELEILFYGDSITEHARGTCVGQPCDEHIAAVFKHIVEEKYKAKSFAIAGDQTPHLLWRLMNGELGALLPKVIVILVGTNDLGMVAACRRYGLHLPHCKDPTKEASNLVVAAERAAATIAQTVDFLLQNCSSNSSQILLQAVLPRGFTGGFEQPSIFTEAIGVLNTRLQALPATRPRAHYVDCNSDFLAPEDGRIVEAFMPDALHPSPAGEVFMLDCLLDPIQQLLQRPPRRKRHRRRRTSTAAGGLAGSP